MTPEESVFNEIAKGLKPGVMLDKVADVVDRLLKERGITKTTKPYLLHMFDQLELKDKYPHVASESVVKIINALPDSWKDQMVSDLVLLRRVPQSKWHQYRNDSWLSQNVPVTASVEAETHREFGEDDLKVHYVVEVDCDLSGILDQIRAEFSGESEEDVASALEDIRAEDFIKELDDKVHQELRRMPGIAAAGVTSVDGWPRSLEGYKEAKLKVTVEVIMNAPDVELPLSRTVGGYFKDLLH